MTKRIFSHISAFIALLRTVRRPATFAAVCTALLTALPVFAGETTPVYSDNISTFNSGSISSANSDGVSSVNSDCGTISDSDNMPECVTHKIPVEFRINSWEIEPAFSDNARNLHKLRELLNEVNSNPALSLDSLTVSGFASPDGSLPKNRELSLRRAFALCGFLNKEYGIPDSMIVLGINEVPWPLFRSIISAGDYTWRDDALRILSYGSDSDAADNTRRMNRLKKLDNGKAWETIKKDVLPQLRSAFVVTTVVTERKPREEKESIVSREPAEVEETVGGIEEDGSGGATDFDTLTDAAVMTDTEAVVNLYDPETVDECSKGWQLGTNALEWGLLIANINGEWDFDCHWSLHASLHYSALNYFTTTRKFRTFIFRTEVRYWFGDGHQGVFVDGHLQMAAYNFALSRWEYRIQDVKGHHPALGGGVGVGYRLPLGKSERWSLEAAVGVGAYHLKYDRFENRPNGQKVDTRSRNWFGIDNVAISIVYNLGKSKSR